jgi:hypothetical protein
MQLIYHPGQIEVQTEANTRPVADMLSDWVGPLNEFTMGADMFVLALHDAGRFEVTTLCGAPPLVEPISGHSLQFPALMFSPPEDGRGLRQVGGIAISLAQRRRARLNGEITCDHEPKLQAHEGFTNCRKYIVPSLALEDEIHLGPLQKEEISVDDPWLAGVVAKCETAFLLTVSPEGQPDVSHRGGPPGFVSLDAMTRHLSWPEYVGDGMLKSGGNVRSCPELTLIAVDLFSGDAAQLDGRGTFTVTLRGKQPRTDGLQQARDPYPVQAHMSVELTSARRLHRLISPRRKPEHAERVTSASTTRDQAPQ